MTYTVGAPNTSRFANGANILSLPSGELGVLSEWRKYPTFWPFRMASAAPTGYTPRKSDATCHPRIAANTHGPNARSFDRPKGNRVAGIRWRPVRS